jgi:hypothetical protein
LIAQLAEGFEAKYHKPLPSRRPDQQHDQQAGRQTAERGGRRAGKQGDQQVGREPGQPASSDPSEHPTRLDNKAEAEALRDRLRERIRPENLGTVVSVETKPQRNRPPPLFDLTTLQREANRRYGFNAAKTLELAQSLYETHKLISYPRTESRHIGEDLAPLGRPHPPPPVVGARRRLLAAVRDVKDVLRVAVADSNARALPIQVLAGAPVRPRRHSRHSHETHERMRRARFQRSSPRSAQPCS